MGVSDNLTAPLVPPGGAFIDEDGFVRITEQRDVLPRILVESHYTTRCFGLSMGCGPALVVQLAGGATDGLFNAVGGGITFELGDGDTKFQILLGVILDFGVERLRPEYIHGAPSPTDELLYLTKKETHALLAFGFTR